MFIFGEWMDNLKRPAGKGWVQEQTYKVHLGRTQSKVMLLIELETEIAVQ